MAASREAATELAPEPGEFFSSFFFLMLSISRGNRARFRFKAMKNKKRPRAPESDAFFSSFFFLMISRGNRARFRLSAMKNKSETARKSKTLQKSTKTRRPHFLNEIEPASNWAAIAVPEWIALPMSQLKTLEDGGARHEFGPKLTRFEEQNTRAHFGAPPAPLVP